MTRRGSPPPFRRGCELAAPWERCHRLQIRPGQPCGGARNGEFWGGGTMDWRRHHGGGHHTGVSAGRWVLRSPTAGSSVFLARITAIAQPIIRAFTSRHHQPSPFVPNPEPVEGSKHEGSKTSRPHPRLTAWPFDKLRANGERLLDRIEDQRLAIWRSPFKRKAGENTRVVSYPQVRASDAHESVFASPCRIRSVRAELVEA